jgi:CO dehydrogenase/acetyl-CoA synthase epsilon subunit
MKWSLLLLSLSISTGALAQVWKTLPKGVRILGYRNITTSKVNSNFNQFRSASPLGSSFRVDAATFSAATNGAFNANDFNSDAYNKFLVGDYKVDAEAQFNVQGTGLGIGITDNVMFYAEVAYYSAQVNSNIKRTSGNSYEQTARALELAAGDVNVATAESLRNFIDADEGTIQSVLTNHYKYKPIGNWTGTGYGDMETGAMIKMVDRGVWGVMAYPGVVLPTGRQDDPNILQDVGFGDGQFDFFGEMASGYVLNDNINFGTTLRYTYQAPTTKELRIPGSRDFTLSAESGDFSVKYGDRINWMVNSTFMIGDWISFTPVYRFMYQLPSQYDSKYKDANGYLGYNSDKQEHQAQLTTTFSSITPFLKKQFALPAQININLVKTIAGKNVPNVARFEVEFRMLF